MVAGGGGREGYGQVPVEAGVAGAAAAVRRSGGLFDLPLLELFEVDDGDRERGDDALEGEAAVVVGVVFAHRTTWVLSRIELPASTRLRRTLRSRQAGVPWRGFW